MCSVAHGIAIGVCARVCGCCLTGVLCCTRHCYWCVCACLWLMPDRCALLHTALLLVCVRVFVHCALKAWQEKEKANHCWEARNVLPNGDPSSSPKLHIMGDLVIDLIRSPVYPSRCRRCHTPSSRRQCWRAPWLQPRSTLRTQARR
jgi:hypothetical protein